MPKHFLKLSFGSTAQQFFFLVGPKVRPNFLVSIKALWVVVQSNYIIHRSILANDHLKKCKLYYTKVLRYQTVRV